MSLVQFFTILRARWTVAGWILMLTLGATLAWILLRPTWWTATAPVLVDLQASDVGGGYAPGLVASYMATQIDVARSERVAERAVETLHAEERKRNPDVPALSAERRRERVATLQDGLQIKPARESNIIHVNWTGRSASEATRVADAVANAFVDVSLELKTGPAKQGSAWFEKQVRDSRQALEQAQLKLSEFQQKAGIVGSEQVDYEMARLTELSTQLAQVQAQTTDSQSKRNASRDTVAEVMQSPLVNGLKADIARLEAQVQQAAATMGPRHPQMQKLDAELAALQSRLSTETSRIARSIETSFQAGRAREGELTAAVNTQRSRVMAVNKDRGHLALLQQDVEAARRAFEAVSTSASKTRLESLTTQTNLVPLMAAVDPRKPAGPTPGQALSVAAIAGLALAVISALLMELMDRRIRSVDDIAMATDLPILATLAPARASPGTLPPMRRRLALLYSGKPA